MSHATPPTRSTRSHRRLLRGGAIAACAALALGAAACGGGGASEQPADGDLPFSARNALASLPDTGAPQRFVVAADLDRADALTGAQRPAADASRSAYADWLGTFDDETVAVPTTSLMMRSPDVRSTLGFDMREARWFVVSETPPKTFMVVHGRPGIRLKEGLPQRDGLAASADTPVGTMTPPATADDMARLPGPYTVGLRQTGNRIALTQDAELGRAWGSGRTQADDDAMESVATALDGAKDGYGLVIATPVTQPTSPRPSPDPAAGMPSFDAVGVMIGSRDGTSHERVAYHVADPSAAAPVIERAWRDGISAVSAEPLSKVVTVQSVTTGDGTVIVDLTSQRPGITVQMLQRADTPMVPGAG